MSELTSDHTVNSHRVQASIQVELLDGDPQQATQTIGHYVLNVTTLQLARSRCATTSAAVATQGMRANDAPACISFPKRHRNGSLVEKLAEFGWLSAQGEDLICLPSANIVATEESRLKQLHELTANCYVMAVANKMLHIALVATHETNVADNTETHGCAGQALAMSEATKLIHEAVGCGVRGLCSSPTDGSQRSQKDEEVQAVTKLPTQSMQIVVALDLGRECLASLRTAQFIEFHVAQDKSRVNYAADWLPRYRQSTIHVALIGDRALHMNHCGTHFFELLRVFSCVAGQGRTAHKHHRLCALLNHPLTQERADATEATNDQIRGSWIKSWLRGHMEIWNNVFISVRENKLADMLKA
ncbi:hypothetical protein HG530_014560 [Fusarium avenaceum]|nr:hypothetical protein HG530_014560 [Fusarium avenaceum]